MSEVYVGETVDLSAITEIGERVPVGQYRTRMIGCDGKLSKANKPMVQATFEVIEGEQMGAEIPMWFSLSVTKKGNKMYASGVKDIQSAMEAVGKPLPQGFAFPLDPQKAAQLLGRAMQEKIVTIAVVPDKREEKDAEGNKTGKMLDSTRAKILKGSSAAPAAAKSTDPWDSI